jgi:3-oxoacyl-[acyl-carrier-protein] synthase II
VFTFCEKCFLLIANFHLTLAIQTSLIIRGLGALSALGENVQAHHDAIIKKQLPFRPISELINCDYPNVPAAWINNRKLLSHRKWSPASMAALHVARQAIENAGWTKEEIRESIIIFGSSRGSAAGWLEPWPQRRAFPLMAASNAMHGEAAAAVSIELGIEGSYQVIATGCSAGIDAMGIAAMHLQLGMAKRALVIAVDLPLVKKLLDNYASTGILSSNNKNDPYHLETSGIFPAEAAAALTLEIGDDEYQPKMIGYLSNSDARDALSLSSKSGKLKQLLDQAIREYGEPQAIIPHATGTQSHAKNEPLVLAQAFPNKKPTLHLLKPYLGHGIGAGSLLETVLIADFLRRKKLIPNLPNLSVSCGFELPSEEIIATGVVLKIAASLGGHNSMIALK